MKVCKYLFVFCAISFLLACGGILYAFKIEPYRVKVNTYTCNKPSPATSELKVVHFSDLHIKKDFTHKNLDKVVKKINAQKPDIVVFTGDLYDNYSQYRDNKNVVDKLQKIDAMYGKYAIWGNRDYGGGAVRQYQSLMEESGFTVLKNSSHSIPWENGQKIRLTGIDDSMLGNPHMPKIPDNDDATYKILLTHEPDTVEHYKNHRYNLTLSGHSHGGQINIPFFPVVNEKAISATELASDYSSGMFTLDDGMKLYVNTGIGTTHISARFGVVPEIAVFHIYL